MKRVLLILVAVGVLISVVSAADPIILRFYYPVGVAGPHARYMAEFADDFNKAHPNIIVEPIYSGSYVETMQRALTASRAGNPPDVAMITTADMWTARDEGIIIPLTSFAEAEGGEDFLGLFFESFINDCTIGEELYALPFQKSTPIFYYNKDMFREAGLDPEKPPTNWDELLEYSRKLVVRENSTTVRWGVQIPVDGWLLAAFIFQNGGLVNNSEGTMTYFDSEETIGALEFMRQLVAEGLMPSRRLFGDSSADFVAGNTAMMYNSTGSLAFVRDSATFDWDAAFLPENVERAVPTGGAQFVIMSGVPEARQEAAWTFVKWMTDAEQVARWSRLTGFVAPRIDAFDLPEMKEYTAEFPLALLARDQLEFAAGDVPQTHSARHVFQLMTDAMEAALAGRMSPSAALTEAQQEAERILRRFR
jgi:sn-glycerol 3-phosphate transport system substrate-binding protein